VSDNCSGVFSASPETIRREPREFDVRRSVGNRRTWQSALYERLSNGLGGAVKS